MKVYGLTGGVGMGKSTSDKFLRERGVPVVDTDAIARQLVEPGQPALKEICAAFGGGIIAADGRLRRDELGRRVFADPVARNRLEEILHPRIRFIWKQQIEDLSAEGHPLAVVDIPLLFETNAASSFDAIVCIACSTATQKKRLRERGWDEVQIGRRIAAQMTVHRKMELSNYVVWTEGSLNVHEAQLRRVFQLSV